MIGLHAAKPLEHRLCSRSNFDKALEPGVASCTDCPSSGCGLPSILTWPFNSSNTALVAGVGFWLTILGLLVTFAGFAMTLRQLAKTQSAARAAAQAAKDQVERIQKSLNRYDAAQEAARAAYALQSARRHFGQGAWDAGAECYEDTAKALRLLRQQTRLLDDGILRNIEKMIRYSENFCGKVDKGDFSSISNEDLAKFKQAIRIHIQHIEEIQAILARDATNG